MSLNLKNAIHITIRKFLGLSVSAHWQDISIHSPSWDERTKVLAGYIPAGSRVIEFGAGRQALVKFLPPGCVYKPSDLVDRGNETLVLDLNSSGLPSLESYDYAVLGGVLEYIHNVPRLLAWISTFADNVVLSYASSDSIPSIVARRGKGWINDYTTASLVEKMAAAGYKETARAIWQYQVILVFAREDSRSTVTRVSKGA